MKKVKSIMRSSTAEYLSYVSTVGDTANSVEMRYEDENIWLTQKMMSMLYDVDIRTINSHIQKIYNDSELEENSCVRIFKIEQEEAYRKVTREVKHYNLQMIIAVGFKINNDRAVQFRKWANQIVKDFTIQGWVMDEERLKNGGSILTKDYFEKQLQKIREIRMSERRFYQKITEIYATAIDYDVTSKLSKTFFATVQNKLHYSVHRHTAAELIMERANEEINQLERLVSAYLDYAEMQAERNIPMTMEDWSKKLNSFLTFMDYEVLQDKGKVSAEIAKLHAESEFEKYRIVQDRLYKSDFDKFMELEQQTKIE